MLAVSICIPAYREIALLEKALDSVVMQRFTDYEVIVADDTPDAAVEDLIRSYDFGGRMHYFRNPHALGAPRNWNEAVASARAPLVKLLHQDDRFAHADALGRFVALMQAHPDCAFGFCASRVEDLPGGREWVHAADAAQLADLKRRPERLLLGNVVGGPSATIYRRALALDYDPRLRWLVDVDFYMRALRQNPRVAFAAEPLVVTSNGPHQISATLRHDTALQAREALLMFEKALDQLADDPDVAVFWWRTLRANRIRSARQIGRLGAPSPAVAAYFKTLFAHPPRSERRRLADFVPDRLREVWRPIRHALFRS
ncbi:glycosyltransferase family 2 protein [Aquabacter spiritensis]|uniref:Glycosyl transferase family 2 n=1 Tax=Aquabacter spiritensis TaxID=933073 RepID=A0A4R3LYW7_9HYPH|nr:glycosyltransferase family 2 protein [Aquabacter spiritensis]TCT03965.1 glycosyl transferase family 2 [Aquabacter spiritensis]